MEKIMWERLERLMYAFVTVTIASGSCGTFLEVLDQELYKI